MMSGKRSVSILFIGNSHTYVNDMPLGVKRRFEEENTACRVTMLAHPGWFLRQHAEDPEARFNIRYGGYDYVVLQEHTHPFAPERDFRDAAVTLTEWIRAAGGIPVLYETWARKTEPEVQAEIDGLFERVGERTGALIAPVGKYWQLYRESHPETEMYGEDGQHASPAGSDFAAKYIFETVRDDRTKRLREGE